MNTKLDIIISEYHTLIENFLKTTKDKIVMIDVDGTMCEFHYTDNKRLLPCLNKDLEQFMQIDNIYAKTRPLKLMQYIVSQLSPENIFVLSTATPTQALKKTKWIRENYPTIHQENIIYTSSDQDKLNALKRMIDNHEKEIMFIDDSYKTLLYIEENLPEIVLVHLSTLMI